jgi:hypothetical protein
LSLRCAFLRFGVHCNLLLVWLLEFRLRPNGYIHSLTKTPAEASRVQHGVGRGAVIHS